MKKKEKVVEKESEMYSITCLLENGQRASIRIAENSYEEGYEELERKIRTEGFFNAEQYDGSILIDGEDVNSLNCKKVIGFIY